MGRRIIYRVTDLPENSIQEDEWKEIGRLQYWYNNEFSWTAGKLAFKRYVIFPNLEGFSGLNVSIWNLIAERQNALAEKGLSELEMISQLERDHLIFVKWGGYFDNSIASGFTRVADNEWNAFLVCDFLLKASTLSPNATIEVRDEGTFIKPGEMAFRNGIVLVSRSAVPAGIDPEDVLPCRLLFAVVDPSRYDKHPVFKNIIPGFNQMKAKERKEVLRNWNWLGYEDSSVRETGGEGAFDLHAKIRRVDLIN